MKVRKGISLLFVLPFILFFILFWFIPFVYGGAMSLQKYSLIAGGQGVVGLDNYIKILASDSMYSKSFFLGLTNTMVFVLCTVPPLVIVSLGLALLVDYLPIRVRGTFRTLYFASYSISVTAVAAIFAWMLKGNGGYLNNLLLSTGLINAPIPWLERQPFVWVSLTIATVWWTIGYNMMLFVNALNEIDPQSYEAADIDGAGFWAKLFHIVFPEIRNVFYFVLMTTIIASFNVYGQPRLMTAGGPGQSTKPLIMMITNAIMDQNNLGMGTAMALLMGVVIIALSLGQYYMTKEKNLLREGRK